MVARNYHQILKVRNNATRQEIRDAYKRCVKQYHPDVNRDGKDTTETFKRVVNAYRVLLQDASPKESPATNSANTASAPSPSPRKAPRRSFKHAFSRINMFRRSSPDEQQDDGTLNLDHKLDMLSVTDLIQRFQASQNRYVRMQAAHSLARRNDLRATLALLREMNTSDKQLKIAIIRSLGESGARRAAYSLSKLLGSKDPDISREASWAMEKIDPNISLIILNRLRRTGDIILKIRAKLAFDKLLQSRTRS
jgi:DnaJ domain/HEAT repeats